MKTTTLPLKHSVDRTPVQFALLLIPLVLACLAIGPQARAACQEGCLTNQNTVLGDDALLNNIGSSNTATGYLSLSSNTSGGDNTATGAFALISNSTGNANTATGVGALEENTTGIGNTAIGDDSLALNTTGNYNTATGLVALFSNTTGNNNTAAGEGALSSNTTGSNNTAFGRAALRKNTIGSFNIALGDNAGLKLTRGNNNIEIANQGIAGEADTIRIGTQGTQSATFIAGISGATIPTGVPVIVDVGGHLGTTTSSARFKEQIKPMDTLSEAILALQPVTFRYKHDLDPDGVSQFGLVAEQVEKVNPDLVARDAQGKPYTVRYEAVNAMLLNEFLKEHRKVELLERAMAEQQKKNAAMRAMFEEQAAQIQKVNAQLELSKPALQAVAGNH